MDVSPITAEMLSQMLAEFLTGASQALVVEEGEVLFDFALAKYSVSGDGRCVLHLWSEERTWCAGCWRPRCKAAGCG